MAPRGATPDLKPSPLDAAWLGPDQPTTSSGTDESLAGLLPGPQGAVGPEGARLTRQNTVVPGCANCTGGRLISCARVGWTPFRRAGKATRPSKLAIAFLTTIFIISLVGTVVLFFTDVFNNTVLTNAILKYNTTAYNIWKDPPVHPLMKVHIFNYTNAEEVLAGRAKKFHVEDVGPYVYRETLSKVNEEFHDNGTITFQEKKSYQFLPEYSNGSQYDNVTVPNLLLMTAMSMLRYSFTIYQLGASAVFTTLKTKAFRSLPLHRFLWGYEDDIITLTRPYLTIKGDFPYKEFGLLVTKNGVSKDRVTINTGEKNLNLLGIIDKYNGVDKLPHWGTDECNRVDASDGTMFPVSMMDGKQTLYIFNQELCRRFPFVFQKKVKTFNEIPTWRYAPPEDVFDDPSTNFANQCYCHMNSANCSPKGVFNSSPCAFGAPVFASFPHFYLGDQQLINSIDGLHPDAEKHKSYIDIHPGLGFPLRVSSKIQLNVQVQKPESVSGFKNLPDNLILPVAWLDVTVEELPKEIKNLVYHGTFSVHQVQLVLSIISVVLLIVSSLFLLVIARSWWFYSDTKS